jgi:hypothetical protein
MVKEDVHTLCAPKPTDIVLVVEHEVGEVLAKPTLAHQRLDEKMDVTRRAEHDGM